MKYRILIYIVFFAFPCALFATEQTPDILICDGKIYELRGTNGIAIYPLEDHYQGKNTERPEFRQCSAPPKGAVGLSTGCWRGYVAIWEIEGKQLFLKGVQGFIADEKVDIRKVFIKEVQNDRVPSFWYSGRIRIPVGRVVQHHFMERHQVPEKWLLLDIKAGEVINRQIVIGETPNKTIDTYR